jgi:phosphate transport system ATP-binding protein
MTETPQQANAATCTIRATDLSLWYGSFQALKGVTLRIRQSAITALIGPSGCGKTTLLRCFNRMNERYGRSWTATSTTRTSR